MGASETRTFQTADGVAVQLPEALGIAPGTAVTVEQVGDQIRIKPVTDSDAARDVPDAGTEHSALGSLGERLREIWKDAPPSETRFRREPIEFPDRPSLY